MPLAHTNNNESVYNDIDEVLAAPPSSLMRYGNTVFLFVIITIFSILIFVKYTDGIACTATVTNLSIAEGNAPDRESVIEQVFVRSDSFVHKADAIVSVTFRDDKLADTLKAPYSGRLTLQRKLNSGDMLNAHVPLYILNKSKSVYAIKLLINEADAGQVKTGQLVNINLGSDFGTTDAEVISLPYLENGNNNFVVDANFTDANKMLNAGVFKKKNCTAFIALQRKSLFAKIF